MGDECVELKNIKYQNMLLNKKTTQTTSSKSNISSLDCFLQKNQKNEKKSWSKLEKATKLKKLSEFCDNQDCENKDNLKKFLLKCLQRKKLQRSKDVNYDEETGKIIDIHGLIFNKKKQKYTLKRTGKKGSTLKCLPRHEKKIEKKV